MPKKEINDYTFYKIVCLDNSVELCYVGSTADFNKRRNAHKSNCNNENSKKYNFKIYKIIRENGGWCNFKMIQIGTREQLTKREADQVEEEYRQELRANMNMIRCYRTEEQKREYFKNYSEENKDKIKEQTQNYYQQNKKQIKEQHQKYQEANKDKIKESKQNYYQNNKDKFKEYYRNYYNENKDNHKEQMQKYREANRDKINEKQNEKVKCECGCMTSKVNLSRHQKSPKHIKLMNQINSQ